MSAGHQCPREAYAAAREAFAQADAARTVAFDALLAAEPAELKRARIELADAIEAREVAHQAWRDWHNTVKEKYGLERALFNNQKRAELTAMYDIEDIAYAELKRMILVYEAGWWPTEGVGQ